MSAKKEPAEQVICNYVSPVTNIKCTKPTKYPRSYKAFVPTCIEHTPRPVRTVSEFAHIDLSAVDVDGVLFYIDKFSNVYHTEDVLIGKRQPRIIGRWRAEEKDIVALPCETQL